MDRLDKVIASQSTATRSEVRKLIYKGKVSVNGEIIKKIDFKVNPDTDEIMVEDKPLIHKKFIYIMMNKPAGVICATFDKKEKTVIDLLPPHLIRKEIFPAGRLDKDTEGFVLITDDGEMAHNILSPRKHIEKEYIARINAPVTDEDIKIFAKGITLANDVTCKPAVVSILEEGDTPLVKIIITEGMYHQIKKMFISRGKKVTYLKRVRMGNLPLDESLALSEARELTADEVNLLLNVKI